MKDDHEALDWLYQDRRYPPGEGRETALLQQPTHQRPQPLVAHVLVNLGVPILFDRDARRLNGNRTTRPPPATLTGRKPCRP